MIRSPLELLSKVIFVPSSKKFGCLFINRVPPYSGRAGNRRDAKLLWAPLASSLCLAACTFTGEAPSASRWCDEAELLVIHDQSQFDLRIRELTVSGGVRSDVFRTRHGIPETIYRDDDHYVVEKKFLLYRNDKLVATLVNRLAFHTNFLSRSGLYPDQDIWSCSLVNRKFWRENAPVILYTK